MKHRVLMCAPTYFEVNYVINPWMEKGGADREVSHRQWSQLRDALAASAEVLLIDPQPGLPDMVFTANAGVVLDGRAMPSHFLPEERRAEESHFKRWFREHGYAALELPEAIGFEGAGDCLFDRYRCTLWTGIGPRTEPEALVYLNRAFGAEVVPLRLIDPRFYHLDTAMCPLSAGHLLYNPAAFHPTSISEIERRVPADKRIAVSKEDAEQFACNAVNLDNHIFMHRASPALRQQLTTAGYELHEIELSEFLKAGGSAKCLTLHLDPLLTDAQI